jgi:multisubunit Na+/H+ antiporter MnhB subunit
MNTTHITIIVSGLIVFLVGYWYLAKSSGEMECPTQIQSWNLIGGWLAMIIGIIIMLVGLYLSRN